jgi:hypothetical protein
MHVRAATAGETYILLIQLSFAHSCSPSASTHCRSPQPTTCAPCVVALPCLQSEKVQHFLPLLSPPLSPSHQHISLPSDSGLQVVVQITNLSEKAGLPRSKMTGGTRLHFHSPPLPCVNPLEPLESSSTFSPVTCSAPLLAPRCGPHTLTCARVRV